MQIIGRIVARGRQAGLFMPFKSSELDGIYNVVEIMGELQIQRVGEPALPEKRFKGLDLEGLFNQRPNCCMTQKELDECE